MGNFIPNRHVWGGLIVTALLLIVPVTALAATFDEYLALINQTRAAQKQNPLSSSSTGTELRDYEVVRNRWEQFGKIPGAQDKLMEQARAEAADPKAAAYDKKTEKCTNWITDFTFQSCILDPVLKFSGSLGLMFGAYVLRGVGWLFDTLIQTVIVQFGTTLKDMQLTDWIARGWTVFRDIANVLIIGMFVFIAICIILGVKEFGQKKLIANVLIVAVLLNFSLLFTRLVIDASNFTAYQIYAALGGKNAAGDYKISEGFLKPMGITSIWNDSQIVVQKMADQQGGNAFQAWIFGWVGGIMLLTVSLVLLYGCFLIAARGILLIFLMITAAVAFATYLIPGMAQGEYGFKKWWTTLFNAAVFAPLLMVFLAISLVVITQASARAPDGVPIGTIIADPRQLASGPGGWSTILLYILGTGLLFISIRMSSKVAGSISGMGYVPGLFRNTVGSIAAAPLTLTAGRLIPALAQRTIGARALGRANALQGAARTANMNAGLATDKAFDLTSKAKTARRSGDTATANRLDFEARALRKFATNKQGEAQKLIEKSVAARKKADKTYNIMDTEVARTVNKVVNNTIFTGESPKGAKGYATRVEEKAKHAAELAEKAKPGDAQRTAIKEKAQEEMEQKHGAELQNRRALNLAAEASRDAAKATRDSAKNANEIAKSEAELERNNNQAFIEAARNLAAAEAAKTDKEREFGDQIRALMTRIDATTDPAEKQRLRQQLTQMNTDHINEMRTFDQRFNLAKTERDRVANELKQTPLGRREAETARADRVALDDLEKKDKELSDTKRSLDNYQRAVDRETAALIKTYEGRLVQSAEEIAAGFGRHEAGIGVRVSPAQVADDARGIFRKKQGNAQKIRELFKAENITNEAPPAA